MVQLTRDLFTPLQHRAETQAISRPSLSYWQDA